jgi:toxin YoeB
MIYDVILVDNAKQELAALKKSEVQAYNKACALLDELFDHPRTGTGKPKPLRQRPGIWSRRITDKHRLVYSIEDMKALFVVLSTKGHYDDK